MFYEERARRRNLTYLFATISPKLKFMCAFTQFLTNNLNKNTKVICEIYILNLKWKCVL